MNRKISIPYGNDYIKVNVKEKNILGIIYPKDVKIGNKKDLIEKALNKPIECEPFTEFISKFNNILFIVNDQTRVTPTKDVLDIIYPKIKNKNIKFLVASGIHRGPTNEEFNFIFGKYYDIFKERIYVHNAKEAKNMVYIGKTKYGTEIWINKLVIDAAAIIPIGSVEPHYFAGYTGGRKSFLPGVASYETIEHNHKYAMSYEARLVTLESNPVHEDMVECIKKLEPKPIFSIQFVLDKENRIYSVKSGNIHSSFNASVSDCSSIFCVNIPEKCDIVVTVALPPLDIDLYQAHKAIENGKLALKKGGIIILVSKCVEGVGPWQFFDVISSCNTPQEVLEFCAKEYKLGYHKFVKLAEMAIHYKIFAFTDLPDYILHSLFIKPYHNLQKAIDDAIDTIGDDAKILFLMSGCLTVPKVNENRE